MRNWISAASAILCAVAMGSGSPARGSGKAGAKPHATIALTSQQTPPPGAAMTANTSTAKAPLSTRVVAYKIDARSTPTTTPSPPPNRFGITISPDNRNKSFRSTCTSMRFNLNPLL